MKLQIKSLTSLVTILFAVAATVAKAHNLDTRATSIGFAKDFVQTMSTRAQASQPIVQLGDEFWVTIKTTPGPGTQTGVGGYQTFYIPQGTQIVDAAYVRPMASDPRGFIEIPMKAQSPIALGDGPIGAKAAVGLTGFSYPSANILGVNQAPVTAAGISRGTLSGVYADTGIFFSTDARTAFNSYGAAFSGGTPPMTNNSGDTVGEWVAAGLPTQGVLGVMTLWDSYQLRAFGRKDVAPIIDPADGRGNAPWGMASAVAGPQSGYKWSYNHAAYNGTSGSIPGAIEVGPWNRIKYPGAQISNDQAGLVSTALGYTGVDASTVGYDFAASGPLPTNTNAVRFGIGQLELGRPEYSAVKIRITTLPSLQCYDMYADAFGGDAGGTDNGKDHIWRYFDPTVVSLASCSLLQKVATDPLISVGANTSFDLTFANLDDVPKSNVVVTDTLPAGLNYVSASPAPTSVSGKVLTWNLGTVPGQGIRTIKLNVTGSATGIQLNSLAATSNGTNIGYAYDTVEVAVHSLLRKEKTVTPSTTSPGTDVTYTITVYNDGTGASGTPMTITDILPPGFTYKNLVSATINGAAFTPGVNSSDLTKPVFTVGQGVAPDKTMVIRFVASIAPGTPSGVYWNGTDLFYENKRLGPVPEAPVTIGGARIGDTVFRDWNGNGTQDAGDGGLPGVTVTLLRDADLNGSYETTVGTRTTDSSGNYLFTGLGAGNYQVQVPSPGSGGVPSAYTLTADPSGSPFTTSHNITLTASQTNLTADWGYRPSGTGTIGNQVFEDINKDGIWNNSEPGIQNVTVNLYHDANANGAIDSGEPLIATQSTNASGIYNFTSLDTTRAYLAQVNTADADIGTYFSAAPRTLTSANPFPIAAGFTTVTTADFGFWRTVPGSIGDQVFVDTDGDGVFDVGEPPLVGVQVQLYQNNILVATTTTGTSGTYSFGSLGPDTYEVRVNTASAGIPSGYSASVTQHVVPLTAGQTVLTADFPFVTVFNKTVNKAFAAPGESLTYTLFPFWPGPSLLTNASISDIVPTGTTFVSAGQGGTLSGLTSTPGVAGSHPGTPGSGSATLVATKDTSLNSSSPTLNYGASTSLTENRGGVNTLGAEQILAQFDLATIPANATITSAQFRLTKTDATNPNINFQIYPLLKSWTEGSGNGVAGVASFNQRNAGTAWTGASTSFDSDAPSADFGSLLAQTTVNGAGTYSWSAPALLSQVQSWYATPANNFGLVLGSDGSGTTDTVWNSRESSATKPELVVSYTATGTPATTTAITVTPSSVLDSGAGVNVNVSMTVTATAAVSNISPTALTVIPGANGATATLVSGPTNSPASIGAGGGSATFTWVYKVFKGTAENQVAFSGGANGAGATFSTATSNGVVVKDAAATATAVWNLGSNSAAVNGSQTGVSGSVSTTITTTKSTWNYEGTASNNYGGDQALVVESNSPFRARSFVEFDLTSIPAGATITSATLRLVHSNLTNAFGDTEAGSPFTVGVRRVPSTGGWVEGDALNAAQSGTLTWNSRGAALWTAPGGDFVATDYGSFVGGAADTLGTIYSVNVLTLANEWYQGSQTNNGLILVPLNNPGSGDHFFSVFSDDTANTANRPQLLITYTPAPTASTTTAVSVLPALVTASGGGRNVNVSMTVTATGAVSNIIPPTNLTVVGTSGSAATRVSGPTNSPASIGAGGGSVTFTWVYNVTAGSTPGQVTLTGTPTGTGATFAAATSNGVIVTPPLTMNVTVNTPPGVNVVNNVASFFNGPTLLSTDDAQTAVTGSIGDFVWADLDGDGVQDSGEPGVNGVRVFIDQNSNGTYDVGEPNATTDANGGYRIYGFTAGTYATVLDLTTLPSGYTPTTASTLSVVLPTAATQFSTADFGIRPAPAPGVASTIGDTLWIDTNENGVVDSGEAALPNITVKLYRDVNNNNAIDSGDILLATTATNSTGNYLFSNLYSGNYLVDADEADPAFPVGLERVSGGALSSGLHDVTLAATTNYLTADFGYNYAGSIGDTVFYDTNENGIQGGGESGVEGVTIVLYNDVDNDGAVSSADTVVGTVFTNGSGQYLFSNLPPGNYVVKVDEQTVQSTPTSGIYGTMLATTGSSKAVILSPSGSMTNLNADFGFIEAAEIEGHVFHDINSNGVFDSGETPLQPVTVRVYGPGVDGILGNADDLADIRKTLVTDMEGEYSTLLPPGSYRVIYDITDPDAQPSILTRVTTPLEYLVHLTAGQEVGGLDFGRDNNGRIGDTIFADIDGTSGAGVGPGAGDARLPNVTVNLYLDINGNGTIDSDGADNILGNADDEPLLDTQATDTSGTYLFLGLANTTASQKYLVAVDTTTLPSSYQTTATSYPTGGIPATSIDSTTLTGGATINIVDFGYPPQVGLFTVSGNIWNDNGASGGTAGDGTKNGAEPNLAAINVTITVNGTPFSVTTDSSGNYSLAGVPGTAAVVITVNSATLPSNAFGNTGDPDGVKNGTTSFTMTNANKANQNFGYREVLASVAGTVVRNADGDGLAEVGETAVSAVAVSLLYAGSDGVLGTSDDVLVSTSTNSSGDYNFTGLKPGIYQVSKVNPSGLYSQADRDGGNPDEIQFTIVAGNPVTGVADNKVDQDFEITNASLGDYVWYDVNGDGTQNGGEPGLVNVRVYVDSNGNGSFDSGEPSTLTNSSGAYTIANLAPGTSTVRIDPATLPAGLFPSFDFDGIGSANSATVTLAANQNRTDVDWGYTGNATVTGHLYIDTNGNGTQDSGEPDLVAVDVLIIDSLGVSRTVSTDSSGNWSTIVPAGTTTANVQENDPQYPTGFTQTQGNDPTSFTAVAGVSTNGGIDGYYLSGAISGWVRADIDNNDTGDTPLVGVTLELRDVTTNALISTTITDSSGNYTFTNLPPGNYKVVEIDPTGYSSVTSNLLTPVSVTAGNTTTDVNFVDEQQTDLGIVKSVNNPTPLVGSQVTFTLVATNHGAGAATGVSVTDNLPSGYTFVSASPALAYNSLTGLWTIGALAKDATSTLTLTATVVSTGNYLNVATIRGDQPDLVPSNDTDDALTTPIQLGAITGAVLEDTDNDGVGDSGIQFVILSLVDGSGTPVLNSSGQPITTTSLANGSYSFGSLPPGTYGVVETQPGGFVSLSDKDGGNLDEIRPITVAAGQTNTANDFVEISRCPDTWADWKQLHPSETAAGNPDADDYDNFAEFAFAMPYDNGSGSEHLGSTAWIIQRSATIAGAIEGVFIRPKGAPLNVTYTLQYAATVGNPTNWQSVVISTSGANSNASFVDNGDCTETVTIIDLETVTGLTDGKGVVRIKAELDEIPSTGTDHTSFTETEGWTETNLEICCRTYNNPYLRESAFTGTISAINGQNLTFALSGAGGLDLADLLMPGIGYYIEVTSGDQEGHRFDVVSGAGNTLTLAADSNIHSAAGPFNTLAGAPPLNLAGDTVALRRHWTINEVFPSDGFFATGSQSTADQIQIFADGAWTIYWLYDPDGAGSIPARWVDAADSGMADKGAMVIPSGQGVFFNKRDDPTSLLSFGEIRENRFVRPLAVGSNLVGGGYPVSQSPNGDVTNQPLNLGRAMNLNTGFFGSRDFKTADSIFVWKADSAITAKGYDTYFFLNGAPTLPTLLRWAKVGDPSLFSHSATPFLLGNRSVFVRAKNEIPLYTIPLPWTP